MSCSSFYVSHQQNPFINRLSKFCLQILLEIDPLFLQFVYYLFVSILGFCLLVVTKPRVNYVDKPSKMDLFFMSVSATTNSSMSVIEMEFFSNSQLLILTFLMFVGGDKFISIVGLQCNITKLNQTSEIKNKVNVTSYLSSNPSSSYDVKEFSIIDAVAEDPEKSKATNISGIDSNHFKHSSIQFLGLVVIVYFLVNHILGFIMIPIYLAIYPNTKNVLKRKNLSSFTFVLFTTVSSFNNCGFVPTNENMIVFKNDLGLLLILIPQILLGNTLYPPCLRFSVWLSGKFVRKAEANYLLETPAQEICYFHWLSAWHSTLLVFSVVGFLLVQFVMFCCMEWNSEGLSELNNYERVTGILFEIVNTRYSGETILDLWNLAPAIWVVFIFMMYIPPYTSYFRSTHNEVLKKTKRRNKRIEELMFSPLSYLVIFIILICITERKKMEEDPLNFNALSIVIEVISAYGNVGFSKGYNCDAQLQPDGNCVSKWYGFSGKWSDEGKFILVVIMLFGTLKKYHLNEGRTWNLM